MRLTGVIGGRRRCAAAGSSLHGVNPALERAFKVRGAKAVALAINCPGGSPVQSALIAERIRALAAEKRLPVLAFIEDVGASGGYWLALAADEIFADARSIVGSIGVIHASFGFARRSTRLGIERRVHTAGSQEGAARPVPARRTRRMSQRLERILHEIHAGFKGDGARAPAAARLEGERRRAVRGPDLDRAGRPRARPDRRPGHAARRPQGALRRQGQAAADQRRRGPGGSAGSASAGVGLDAALVDGALDGLAERALWGRYGLWPDR